MQAKNEAPPMYPATAKKRRQRFRFSRICWDRENLFMQASSFDQVGGFEMSEVRQKGQTELFEVIEDTSPATG